MKTIAIIFTIAATFLFTQSAATLKIPKCIQDKIDSAQALAGKQYMRFDSYLYKGKVTYLAQSGCCDQMNPLFDGECKYICAPSGGFIGTGDGKCKDFHATAKFLGTVWIAPKFERF